MRENVIVWNTMSGFFLILIWFFNKINVFLWIILINLILYETCLVNKIFSEYIFQSYMLSSYKIKNKLYPPENKKKYNLNMSYMTCFSEADFILCKNKWYHTVVKAGRPLFKNKVTDL